MFSRRLSYIDLKEYEMYSDILDRNAQSGSFVEAYRRTIMQIAIDMGTAGYTCLRPPGAAGAILATGNDYILGCVEPAAGHSCKDHRECEMENGHCVRNPHAEVRTILIAAAEGICTKNSSIYSILKPCYNCTKVLIAAGVKYIYYAGVAYNEERTAKLLEMSRVECSYIDMGLSYANLH